MDRPLTVLAGYATLMAGFVGVLDGARLAGLLIVALGVFVLALGKGWLNQEDLP